MKLSVVTALSLATATFFASACASHRSETPAGAASISIESSNNSLIAGDTATFIARTNDTYGRDTSIKWTSTAGDLNAEEDGRVARVKFEESGTYSVKATLLVDGRAVQSDLVEVRVRSAK